MNNRQCSKCDIEIWFDASEVEPDMLGDYVDGDWVCNECVQTALDERTEPPGYSGPRRARRRMLR